MKWGDYNEISLFYPGNIIGVRKGTDSHLPVGLYFNGYKLTYKTRRVRVIGWRTKIIHITKRFAELLDNVGFTGLYILLSNRYQKKDAKRIFNKSVLDLQKHSCGIEASYADKIEYKDLNNYTHTHNKNYSEQLEILLRQKNNLQIVGDDIKQDLYTKEIDKKISALRVKSICNYLGNQTYNDEREKKLYIYGKNFEESVSGYIVTQKIKVGKIVFSIKKFNNTNNEQDIVIENIGDVIVPLAKKNKKYLQQNYHKIIAVQLAKPGFIEFLHESFNERNKMHMSESLDLDNEPDFFYYLAAYESIDKDKKNTDNNNDNRDNQYRYLLVDEKNIQKNMNLKSTK